MAVKSNLTNMVICLTATCLICAALLGGVYALTASPIEKVNAAILKSSIGAVLPEGCEISEAMELEVGGQPSEYYVATKDGQTIGFAVKSTTVGFGGPLTLMVGLIPGGTVYNTSVLSHAETPGLGAKCTSDPKFMEQWKGFDVISKKLTVKKDGGDVDAITASTITSRAYAQAVQNAVDALAAVPAPCSEVVAGEENIGGNDND